MRIDEEADVKAYSKSLNVTITKLMKALHDHGKRPGGRGANLREFLHDKMADFGHYWYRRGVRRGHMESRKTWLKTDEVPKKFVYKATRVFFDGRVRDVKVKSKAKK